MDGRVEHVLQEALNFPAEDRFALATALIASLKRGEDAAGTEAGRHELEQRRLALREGTTSTAPWADVRARLLAL